MKESLRRPAASFACVFATISFKKASTSSSMPEDCISSRQFSSLFMASSFSTTCVYHQCHCRQQQRQQQHHHHHHPTTFFIAAPATYVPQDNATAVPLKFYVPFRTISLQSDGVELRESETQKNSVAGSPTWQFLADVSIPITTSPHTPTALLPPSYTYYNRPLESVER